MPNAPATAARGSPHGVRIAASLAALSAVLAASAQTLSPGEVRINSHPYQPQPPVLRTESRLVRVEVVVRGSRGHAVAGLTKDDFALFDSGHRRDISTFSVETSGVARPPAPTTSTASTGVSGKPGTTQQVPGPSRWIGLFFDDINTPSSDLVRAKIAAKRFISEATRSGERVGVFTTSQGEILPFTTDAGAVLQSVTTIQSHRRMSAAGLSGCPRITPYQAYLIAEGDPATIQAKVVEACNCYGQGAYSGCDTRSVIASEISRDSPGAATVVAQGRAIWNQTVVVTETTLDAVHAAIGQLAQAPGKRILLFASSGFLSGGLEPEEREIMDEALGAHVTIDSLDSKGLYAEQPGGPQGEPAHGPSGPGSELVILNNMESLGDQLESEDYAMADFAEGTGGLLFRNDNDLDLGFRDLGLAPTIAYVLGFPPAEDGRYHKIKVKVEKKKAAHDFIQALPGYFAPTKKAAEASEAAPKGKIDAEVSGTDERNDFPVSVSAEPAGGAKGQHGIHVLMHVDISKLPFEEKGGRHDEQLTFVVALFDEGNKFVTGKAADMDFALKRDSLERFSKSGITGELSLEAPPGNYRLRAVVEEAVTGKISATSEEVRIE